MISRFRTYGMARAGAFVRQDEGTAGLRPCAGTAPISSFFFAALFFILLFITSTTARAATPPRTIISNTAFVSYSDGLSSAIISINSNSTWVSTVPPRTTAAIELLQYAPSAPGSQLIPISITQYSQGGNGPFAPLNPPVPAGSTVPIDLSQPVPLVRAGQYHAGEPVFIRLTDADQNWDPAMAETVIVSVKDAKTGDEEVLRLSETGLNTGVFTGYIQSTSLSGTAGSGALSVTDDSSITASYTDPQDGTGATAQALVDPYGKVFSTANGELLDGLTLTLFNAVTGQPAVVFGDDGVSAYPAVVTSGGTATDSSGAVYTFPPGGYRFPFIAPGQYYLTVVMPAGYKAPSTVSTAEIQKLPGAPFAVVDPGSRGETFTVNAGPAIHIDIPVDQVTGRLYLLKSAGKTLASQGDFVQYRLIVENVDTTYPVLDVAVHDKLPPGFRYRTGSARLGGAKTADPGISADGRTLTFSIGTLGVGVKADISYVTEVSAGARAGKAVNFAIAADLVTGTSSNTATAVVEVKDAFFNSRSTIAGRLLVDGCGDLDKSEKGGLADVRIYLEDGTSAVTDKNGMYHFEGVLPGTHAVQIDTDSIPEKYEIVAACNQNSRFAGNLFSQFVDVQGGTLWRADFNLALKEKLLGEVAIELRTRVKFGDHDGSEKSFKTRKDIIQYAVPIHVGAVPARNVRITVILPQGADYRPGSCSLDFESLYDPDVMEGTVTFRLKQVPAQWEGTIRFEAEIPASGQLGEFSTWAVVTADTPQAVNQRTPPVDNKIVRKMIQTYQPVPDVVLHPKFGSGSADLTGKDKKELDRLIRSLRKVVVKHLLVTGHTDSQPLSYRLRKKFPDNYALSQARAASVGSYIAAALKLSPDQVTYDGKGPDEPVSDNRKPAGRAKNRRVELRVETRRLLVVSAIQPAKDTSGMKAVATIGLRPGEAWQQAVQGNETSEKKGMPEYGESWLQKTVPELAWLWPPDGYYPPIPSVKIAIKHDPAKKLKLFLNGEEVDPLYLDGTVKRQDNKVGVSVWKGVHLHDGDNVFEAAEYDHQGAETAKLKRVMHYSTSPVKAELLPEKSRLNADGKNTPVIAIRFTDKDGHPAREGVVGEYTIDPPYIPRQRAEDLQKNPLTASVNDRLQFLLKEDGVAFIELQPTTATGEAVVRFNLVSGEHVVRVWLTPEDRDWILVGLAEGTAGYNTITGNMESGNNAGEEDKLYHEGRVAFYAKGRVKGEWLLTMAYDSDENENQNGRGLFQVIDPNKYYLLYGDAAEQRYDAASAKKLYLKLERDQFYALFGDYHTGLTVTELSRYSRNFTGLKSELKTGRYEYNVFMSETNQAYVRDEIRGDGTSGLYRLSRKNLVLNSESVRIETRDRFKSEVIVSTRQLSRFLDYSIDYDTGSLWFKSPVYSRDENLNPVYIVVEYESFDAADTSYNYGGRAAVRFLENKLETGATHLHEGRLGGEGDLNGADVTYKLDDKTRVRAEAAASRTDQMGATSNGSAYLAEITHSSAEMAGKAYIRQQESGFGLGQQSGGESGTRKTGFDIAYRLSDAWNMGGEAFRQENLSTEAVRDMAQIKGQYIQKRYDVSAGFLHAEDTFSTGGVQSSDQVFLGGRYNFTDRLSGRVRYDRSLSENSNSDFPTRATMGVDYRLNQTAALFAEQERTWGAREDSATSRIGMRISPWTGAQMSSTVEEQNAESGIRLFSTTGLKQAWQVNKNWSLDAGLDRTATIRDPGNSSFNVNVPQASGGGVDYIAVSVGAGYRQEKWSWTGRVETRESEIDHKRGVMTGVNGEPSPGIGLAGGIQAFRTVSDFGTQTMNGDFRFGLAYRPFESRWIVLDRIDYLVNEQQTGAATTSFDNRRIVNNLSVNYTVAGSWQVSILNGIKYVRETIDSSEYRGYTALIGAEGRYDFTKKWDAGMRVLMLESFTPSVIQYVTGFSVGYNMARNIWISLGYNMTGFQDRDFSKADFTAEGPFVKFRLKFDQSSARETVKWITGM